MDVWTVLDPWDFDTEREVAKLLNAQNLQFRPLLFDSHITDWKELPRAHVLLYQREES